MKAFDFFERFFSMRAAVIMTRFLILTVALVAYGCAYGVMTKFSVVPIAPEDGPVSAILSNGQIVAVQRKTNVVSVYFQNGQVDEGYRAAIYIAVKNETKAPVKVNTGDVWFEAVDGETKRGLLAQSRDEVIARIHEAYNSRAAVAILLGALSAASASIANSTTYESGSFSAYVPGTNIGRTYVPGTTVYGNYAGSTYNPALGSLATEVENRRTAGELSQMAAERDVTIARITAQWVSSRTVEPR